MTVLPYTRPPEDARPDVALERRHRWLVLLADVGQLAHAIANTDFVPKAMRGNEAAIAATILYGDEVGLSPMQSLSKIAVIDGKPSLAAEAQRALILAAGHNIWFEETSVSRVTVAGKRHDADMVQRVTWTLDDARRARLDGKQNWRQYPRAMLIARASAELARAQFADVIGGLAATEELEDIAEPTAAEAPPDGAAPPPASPPASSRRRRASRASTPLVAPAPAQTPDAPPEPPLPDEEPGDPGPPKATEPQLRKMFALFGELGMRDRDARLKWATGVLGRDIETASDLTDLEASALIDALEQESPIPEHEPEQHAGEDAAGEQPTLEEGAEDK